MSLFDGELENESICGVSDVRSSRFEDKPGFYEPAGLWFYGNIRLLHANLAYIEQARAKAEFSPTDLDEIEKQTERLVLDGKVLVCGIHNEGQSRSAIVPLRWGSPRIVVFSGGFYHHLGQDLNEEPFRAARLWRYQWDPKTDLAVSRRAPDRLPTFAKFNPGLDRLIAEIAMGTRQGLNSIFDTLTAIPSH